jgi:hypothetical protein
MAIYNLDFLNKNQFRCFPFKAESSSRADDGRRVENSLIAACTITTTIDRLKVHVSQIYVENSNITITISAKQNNRYISLGYFYAENPQSFQSLTFYPFERFVGGQLVLGSSDTLHSMAGGYFFNAEALALEESNIYYYTPPAVRSLTQLKKELRGNVVFGTLTNLAKTKQGNVISLSVLQNTSLASLADFASKFNNCRTPLIFSVSGAKPQYDTGHSSHEGNMYLVGIKPVIFYGVMGNGALEVQTKTYDGGTLNLNTLCTARNKVLPPVDPVYLVDRNVGTSFEFIGKKNYHSKSFSPPQNFFGYPEPEFLSWPQFFKSFSKILINAELQQNYEIVTVPQDYSGGIRRIVYKNSGLSDYVTTISMDGAQINESALVSVPAGATVVKHVTSSAIFTGGTKFMTNIVSTTGNVGTLQIMLFYR